MIAGVDYTVHVHVVPKFASKLFKHLHFKEKGRKIAKKRDVSGNACANIPHTTRVDLKMSIVKYMTAFCCKSCKYFWQ